MLKVLNLEKKKDDERCGRRISRVEKKICRYLLSFSRRFK